MCISHMYTLILNHLHSKLDTHDPVFQSYRIRGIAEVLVYERRLGGTPANAFWTGSSPHCADRTLQVSGSGMIGLSSGLVK